MDNWPTMIVQDDIDRYAALSGDNNPIHVDPEFARTTPYGSTIAHGPMTAALVMRHLTQDMGFAGRIRRLSLKYVAPVRSGDRLSCEARRAAAPQAEGEIYEVACRNQDGTQVSVGTALVAAEQTA